MRAKDLWSLVPLPSRAIQYTYSRVTLTRFTAIYFVLALLHAILQGGFQLGSNVSNARADKTLSELMSAAAVKPTLIPIIAPNDNGQDVLRLCNGIPSSPNDERCQTIFAPATTLQSITTAPPTQQEAITPATVVDLAAPTLNLQPTVALVAPLNIIPGQDQGVEQTQIVAAAITPLPLLITTTQVRVEPSQVFVPTTVQNVEQTTLVVTAPGITTTAVSTQIVLVPETTSTESFTTSTTTAAQEPFTPPPQQVDAATTSSSTSITEGAVVQETTDAQVFTTSTSETTFANTAIEVNQPPPQDSNTVQASAAATTAVDSAAAVEATASAEDNNLDDIVASVATAPNVDDSATLAVDQASVAADASAAAASIADVAEQTSAAAAAATDPATDPASNGGLLGAVGNVLGTDGDGGGLLGAVGNVVGSVAGAPPANQDAVVANQGANDAQNAISDVNTAQQANGAENPAQNQNLDQQANNAQNTPPNENGAQQANIAQDPALDVNGTQDTNDAQQGAQQATDAQAAAQNGNTVQQANDAQNASVNETGAQQQVTAQDPPEDANQVQDANAAQPQQKVDTEPAAASAGNPEAAAQSQAAQNSAAVQTPAAEAANGATPPEAVSVPAAPAAASADNSGAEAQAAPNQAARLRSAKFKRAFSAVPVMDSTTGAITAITVTDLSDNGSTETVTVNVQCAQALTFAQEIVHTERNEDLVLLGYYIWVFGVSTAAVFTESVPHVIAAFLLSVLGVIYNGVQLSRTTAFRAQFKTFITDGACSGLEILPGYWKSRTQIEVPSLVLNALGVLLLGVLSFKLYTVYQRETEKLVDGSGIMKHLYKMVLTLSVVIQMGTFLVIASIALWLAQLFQGSTATFSATTPAFQGIGVIMALAAIPWFAMGWIAVRKEHKFLMIAFLIVNGIFLAYWVAVFASDVYRIIFTKWTFFAALTISTFFLLVISFTVGILYSLHFGQGLAPQLAEKSSPAIDVTPWDYSNNTEKAWEPFDILSNRGSSVPRDSTFDYGIASPPRLKAISITPF